MFDQLSAEILASLIKGFPTPTPTTKQNVDPAVYYIYSRVKINILGHYLHFLLLSLWWAKVSVFHHFHHIKPVIFPVG
jgi:hypothetical protein